jgi:hypothetical protein
VGDRRERDFVRARPGDGGGGGRAQIPAEISVIKVHSVVKLRPSLKGETRRSEATVIFFFAYALEVSTPTNLCDFFLLLV